MKMPFRRLSVPSGLRQKRVTVPALVLVAGALIAGLWFLGHSGGNSVWSQPSTPISDVLNRVDQGQIASASINGQRILVTDTSGHQSWTIEKDATMGTTEQYLRAHAVKVSVVSTDEASFTAMLPNLLALLVLMALLVIMLRRSNLLGNPMGARVLGSSGPGCLAGSSWLAHPAPGRPCSRGQSPAKRAFPISR